MMYSRLSLVFFSAFTTAAVLGAAVIPRDTDSSPLKSCDVGLADSGIPLLGKYPKTDQGAPLANWMKTHPDSTLLTALNLPGTHDTATWSFPNASNLTADGSIAQNAFNLLKNEALDALGLVQTQSKSIYASLQSGIRALDLRIGPDFNDNSTILLYHSDMVQLSPNVTLASVLEGLYCWLDDHPTEALVVSIKVDYPGEEDYQDIDEVMLQTITEEKIARYWVTVEDDKRVTLGDARGKIWLLRRMVMPLELQRLGLNLTDWPDNNNFTRTSGMQTVIVEDHYDYNLALTKIFKAVFGKGTVINYLQTVVNEKAGRVMENLQKAIDGSKENLYITFASAQGWKKGLTPEFFAGGVSPFGDLRGVNAQVNGNITKIPKAAFNPNLGIVFLDYFEKPAGLV